MLSSPSIVYSPSTDERAQLVDSDDSAIDETYVAPLGEEESSSSDGIEEFDEQPMQSKNRVKAQRRGAVTAARQSTDKFRSEKRKPGSEPEQSRYTVFFRSNLLTTKFN